MANLAYQITSSIDKAFGPEGNGGISKRSIKHDDFYQMKDHTISYSEKSRLKTDGTKFANWMKENHPNVKMVKELTREHSKEYLLSCHKFNGGNCNSNSVNTYEQSLDKIAHLCNRNFGCTIDLAVDHRELPQDGEKLRRIKMERSIYDRAVDTVLDRGQSKMCLRIAGTTAMRASEFENLQVRDINFQEMTLHIHGSKGGRNRDISLSKDAADILANRIKDRGLSGCDKIFTIRANTICKTLSRALDRVGHDEYVKAKTSVHSVRKMVAQEMYVNRIKEYLKDGMSFKDSEKEALGDVSEFLGHGRQRTVEAYVDRYGSLTDFEDAGF